LQLPVETDLFTTVVMAHPRRAEAANQLARSIGHGARVIFDPDPDGPPSSSRAAARAWRHCDSTVSHHLVLQDDVVPTPLLLESVARAISAHPDSALALYANSNSWHGGAARVALLAGYGWVSWVPLEYFPTVAAVLPCHIAHEFADIAEQQGGAAIDSDDRKDDMLMRSFLESRKYRALVRTSALVEHKTMPSIAGNDVNEVRRSVCLAAPDEFSTARESFLSGLLAWPNFAYHRARLKLPSKQGRSGFQTQEREDHLMAVGLHWDDLCAMAAELRLELPEIPARHATQQRFLQELFLASYTAGWSLAAVQGPGARPPRRTPVAEAALRSYAEAGLTYQSAVEQWADHFGVLIDFMWRALELARSRR
jgi:hypothetical protein